MGIIAINHSNNGNENIKEEFMAIADVQVNSSNYLTTHDDKGRRIAGTYLSSGEEFMGFGPDYYVTVNSSNYIQTYDENCRRIAGTYLSSGEVFKSCGGSTITTKNSSNYLQQYDKNLKRGSGRYA